MGTTDFDNYLNNFTINWHELLTAENISIMVFILEDVRSMFLRNISIYLQVHTALHDLLLISFYI
jgi:hypothetical protein